MADRKFLYISINWHPCENKIFQTKRKRTHSMAEWDNRGEIRNDFVKSGAGHPFFEGPLYVFNGSENFPKIPFSLLFS